MCPVSAEQMIQHGFQPWLVIHLAFYSYLPVRSINLPHTQRELILKGVYQEITTRQNTAPS